MSICYSRYYVPLKSKIGSTTILDESYAKNFHQLLQLASSSGDPVVFNEMASNGIWKKPSAKTCTRRKSQVRSLRIDPTCSSFRRGTSPGLLALTKMQKVNSMMLHVFFPPRKRKQNPNIRVFQKCIKFLSYHSYHSYHSHHHVWLHCTKSQLVQHVESWFGKGGHKRKGSPLTLETVPCKLGKVSSAPPQPRTLRTEQYVHPLVFENSNPSSKNKNPRSG